MLELFAVTSSTFQLLLEVPITSCTAQPQSRSAFCFISLIKFLNLAGVLELFSVTSSTFQSLLQVPITTRTAQIHPRSALCFISLIKSLNLAGLLQYLVVTSLTFQLLLIINATTWTPSPSNAHSPRAMHHWLGLALLVSRLLIIISEFDDGESFKAYPPQLHPPASQRKCPVVPMM